VSIGFGQAGNELHVVITPPSTAGRGAVLQDPRIQAAVRLRRGRGWLHQQRRDPHGQFATSVPT